MIYINLERRIIMIKCDNLSESQKKESLKDFMIILLEAFGNTVISHM